jgi:hypothetical protein
MPDNSPQNTLALQGVSVHILRMTTLLLETGAAMDARGDTGDYVDTPRPTIVGRFPSPDPLFADCPGLFVQAEGTVDALPAVASLVREEGMGTVFTMGRGKNRQPLMRQLAQAHRQVAGPIDHVLFDADRYSGQSRRVGATVLDAGWIKAQRAVGVRLAMTDSPYIPARDRAALVSTLAQTKGFGEDAVAVLPLGLAWLTKDVASLIAAINQAGVRVALVLEHPKDPLGVQAAVVGLVRLLDEVDVQVALLRSDVSAIGALAFGASMGAVGTSTSLRHYYPAVDGGGIPRQPSIAAYVPWSMCYRTLQKINAAIDADPDNQHRWCCQCRFCNGALLHSIVSDVQAFQHSLAAIAILGEEILNSATPSNRRCSWVSKCKSAQHINKEIAEDTGMSWNPPAYLAGWQKPAV